MELNWQLITMGGPSDGQRTTLAEGKSLTIGRTEDCDVCVIGVDVSRQHARLSAEAQRPRIEDLGSQNGVYVDGARISGAASLRSGSKITIGYQNFEMQLIQVETGFWPKLKALLIQLKALPEHQRAGLKYPAIFVEAALFSGLALLIVGRLGLQEAGVFGLFLAAASLVGRFEAVLSENKHNIFVAKLTPSRANLITAQSILMLFLGICCAYLIAAITYTATELATHFAFIFDMVNLNDSTLFTRRFSNLQNILSHNLMVSVVILLLCGLYRSYAALLTLGWNAAVWVLVLVTLTRRALEADVGNLSTVVGLVFITVTPHLVLEGAGYILMALAAIWYSKGLTRYALSLSVHQPISDASHAALARPSDEVLQAITRSCAKVLALGLLVLLAAALVETTYVPWMLEHVKGAAQR